MECDTTKKVRLGLIGLGYIGKIHLRNCLNLESAKLVAVSDISKKNLGLAKKMSVKSAFSNYQQLLENPDVDAVIISLPTYLHLSCAQKSAEAGKDIFVEKPLARNVADGKEIISAAKRNGVKLMVGYQFRFSSAFRDLRYKIRTGVLGEVQIAYATNIGSGPFYLRTEGYLPRPVPSWWFTKELTGGGALIDMGCHMINLLRWYFGEVTDVKSYLGYRLNLDFEDHAICLAKFAAGQTAIINVGWFSRESQIKVELLGTVKHAFAAHNPQNRIITALQLLTTKSCKYNLPYLRELEHFVHCVRHDLQPSPSGNDALKDLETISLAYTNGRTLK